jgi:hypothetical protein
LVLDALEAVDMIDIAITSDVTIGADNGDVVLPLRLGSTMFLLANNADDNSTTDTNTLTESDNVIISWLVDDGIPILTSAVPLELALDDMETSDSEDFTNSEVNAMVLTDTELLLAVALLEIAIFRSDWDSF